MAGGEERSFAAAANVGTEVRQPLLDRLCSDQRILWWWAGLVVVVLLAQNPMFRNHLAALVAPFALLVARYRPSWRAVVITALITVPYQAYQLRPLLLPKDYSGRNATIVDALRKLPSGAWALSDEPGLVWRAGKGTDPFFVDPSVLRIGLPVKQISFDQERLLDAAANPRECAVVVTSPARFGSFPALPERLAGLGYEHTEDFGHGRGIWIRRDCTPSA
jgi:hypothetical protein